MCNILTIGTLVVDLIAIGLPKIAEPGEAIHVTTPIDMHIGGHAANVAIDMLKLGYKGELHVCGAISNDLFGEVLRNCLSRFRINCHLQIVEEAGTARNLILVVKGEDRRFHIYPGANRYLSSRFVIDVIRCVRPCATYIAIGFSPQLDERIADVINAAKNYNSIVLVDVAYPRDFTKKAFLQAMNYADIIHCNDRELVKLLGVNMLDEGLNVISKSKVKIAFITLGSRGAIAVYDNHIIRQKPYKVDVKDPTGAGDAFCSGILIKLHEHGFNLSGLSLSDVSEILAYAQAVGALATTKPGTTTAIGIEPLRDILKQKDSIIKNQEVIRLQVP